MCNASILLYRHIKDTTTKNMAKIRGAKVSQQKASLSNKAEKKTHDEHRIKRNNRKK